MLQSIQGENMKVVIIYGTDCNRETAWIPWLEKQLNTIGIECLIPNFPTPINQNYLTWSNIMDAIELKSEDIVVAWSIGAIFSVRYLYEHNLYVRKLINISGFNNYIGDVPFVDNINQDFFMKDESGAHQVAHEIICIKSDNDPFITQTALSQFAQNLNGKVISIKDGGHFNKQAGYLTFPLLVDLIRSH